MTSLDYQQLFDRVDLSSKKQPFRDDPSVPVFKIPCLFKGKKLLMVIDCCRERVADELVVCLLSKKEKMVLEVKALNVFSLVVLAKRKKLSFYIEENGDSLVSKMDRKKIKGKKAKKLTSDNTYFDEEDDDDDDPKKVNIKFHNENGCYLAGYLIQFLRRLARGEDVDDTTDELDLFMGTWNVGNTPPDNDNFSPWIPVDTYDVYIIGGQEAEYDPRKGFSTCSEDWVASVTEHIGSGYVLLSYVFMWEIRLLVYVRTSLLDKISAVSRSKEATGIGSVIPNKGGVCISFKYNERTFCFLNSHLAAHQEKISARNNDVMEIIDEISMNEIKDISTQFHHIFWCGDLNYRIDRTREDVIEICNRNEHETLLKDDQLNIERDAENVFVGFTEGPITFKPTYKFDNHQPHDYYSEERNRVPAWCDRILWSSWDLFKEDIVQTQYDAAYEIITSDHVPVYSTFKIRTDKPCIPAVLSSQKALIVLKDISAINLQSTDSNGLSDPFFKVDAPFLIKSGETEVRKNTLNPEWTTPVGVIPVLHETVFLEKEHLLIQVRDKDPLGSDLVGRATLGLEGKLDGNEHHFEMKIRKHGLHSGTVSGTIIVVRF